VNKLSDKQFKKYRQIVYNETGINLNAEKRELLNARIAKRLRKLDIGAEQYLTLIQEDPRELKVFLDAISTNHTYFYREPKSFKYLNRGPRKIWCAASSSGEEPYSLATYCLELGFAPSILATDIAESCLQTARQAVYPVQRIEGIAPDLLKRYFQKGHGRWKGYVRVKPNIRQMVRFDRFNLLKDIPALDHFDMIFCRNVMIYFDRLTKEKVVAKLYGALKPGGHFIIGGAESLSGLHHPLKYVEPSVYKKS
jgi:chemotaxis protein methyltransferase CheR